MWLSTTQLARIKGVTSQTIRRQIEDGVYPQVQRTTGGHFRVFVRQQRRIAYARVSSAKQRSSLDTQKTLLLKRYPDADIICDVASAFNFRRKGLQAILEPALRGDAIHLVATTSDRVARSGFELIRWLIELQGGRVELLEQTTAPTDSFDVSELISFVTSFCNSHYGKRSVRRRRGQQENPHLPG